MTLPRLLALVVTVGLVLTAAVPAADACGVWHLTDTQRGTDVAFYINSALVTKGPKKVGAIYVTEAARGLRSLQRGKILDDIRDGQLRRRGKQVGTVDAATGTVRIGRATYVITLSDRGTWHDAPSWQVKVTRGGEVVASGKAMSMCAAMHADPPLTEAELEDEIRRRVIYYLTWRDLRS